MAHYRQTNHNGRVNAKTGKAYSRKHNDRQYDVTKAENINESMVIKNIILHYDKDNVPHVIDNADENRTSIDEHEHTIYQELFGDSLSAQHRRNEAARHPERNKSIDDLLDSKNTCPEETIFQIGSVDDGFPDSSILMEIFEDYQREVIARFGHNIHFLDAALHLDEAVPHIHVRKVWAYDGKDGLDISQNKALEEMGFERPEPDKAPNKWNNAKITFSEWERDIKLKLCQKYGLDIELVPKVPGKTSMTKEEAIAVKLQAKNHEAEEKLNATEKKLAKVSAELVTEEMKNKEISDTNIFGRPRKIEVTAQEYRSWQRSAETKEHNEALVKKILEKEKELSFTAMHLSQREALIKKRESRVDSEVQQKVDKLLPGEIKRWKEYLFAKEEELNSKEKKLSSIAEKQHDTEVYLKSVSDKLNHRKAELDEEVKKSVADIIKDAFKDFFTKFKATFFKRFEGKHQSEVISVIQEMPIDDVTADRLFKYGFYDAEKFTVGEILERAEAEDIKDALHEAGANYRQIKMSNIEDVKNGLSEGQDMDALIHAVTEQVAQNIVRGRHK
ncbi:hypothetical protein [Agathobacter ruminis]|uniref:Recombinase n=1 Tax=Agathobacter ruminis TaxID=1712665 RepID=A0A2G3E4K2_9FIRM|nr:hypothetical protein [Agathobacter ruminis]MDC7301417.1 hypothetical protein [Agathobacter ruminis]PHU38227.1 hypothetical protein CSX02_03760 [Agathobacter ruminis]